KTQVDNLPRFFLWKVRVATDSQKSPVVSPALPPCGWTLTTASPNTIRRRPRARVGERRLVNTRAIGPRARPDAPPCRGPLRKGAMLDDEPSKPPLVRPPARPRRPRLLLGTTPVAAPVLANGRCGRSRPRRWTVVADLGLGRWRQRRSQAHPRHHP